MDKLSPMYGEDLGLDLFANRKVGEAVRQLTETAALAPEDFFAHSLLALAFEADGKTAESLAQAEQQQSACDSAGTTRRTSSRARTAPVTRAASAARALERLQPKRTRFRNHVAKICQNSVRPTGPAA
jgi:hypothetical protein